ncbi:OmpA family protein [Brunnivagina elsteri]|uniref:Cell envelope biogenesis protein OmpA n=1 Tax=Brunnivagina elsteri CCALA 953 TaxID=987040 RepID=A0A2A2TLK1_9CYAN|nr:OmpA family protein [Calothrix elsteri]PAX57112.1 cell envelope biogenesis protein OmpA [Calothrix elsteri CCALA 953]
MTQVSAGVRSRFSGKIKERITLFLLPYFLFAFIPNIATAQTQNSLKITVNSNGDEIKPDESVTLREAIALSNNTLALDKLTPSEKAQVQPASGNSRIEFNLPAGQTTIQLTEILPALTSPGVVIDGTTQPGYDRTQPANAKDFVPALPTTPVVAITPASGKEVFRGLSIVADNITIRGLSLYGFTSKHQITASLPPADIFIASSDIKNHTNPAKNVVIEDNWLGITPDEKMPEIPSAFGVSVFNAVGTIIKNNRISYHDGSAIITGFRGEQTQVIENVIIGNGLAGMPDAIRLDGKVDKSEIRANLLCANDGSGVFLFKPEGAVEVKDNDIRYNGRRLRRAAVYLMGSDHKISNNKIINQAGSGVVVTAFPPNGSFNSGASVRNQIENNRFAKIEGLSIDLNTRGNVDVQDFQRGDGKNPKRTSANRRLDTGNAAINSPEFLSKEFLNINNKVHIDGITEPGSEVQIYQVTEGALNQVITSVKADEKGKFGATLENLQPGEMVSAIATHPKYGTSEPAYSALVTSTNPEEMVQIRKNVELLENQDGLANPKGEIPNCTTPKPPEPTPEPPVEPTPEPPPEAIRLRVPNNIHYALDKDFISGESGKVLDKIAAVLQQYPTIVIELQGHTDARASDAYNKDLAFRRATKARNYLIKKGIAPERMTLRSFGERKLKTPGRDRVEHAYNRRVEVMFFDIRGIEIILEPQDDDLQIER